MAPRHRQTITGHLMSMSSFPASTNVIFSVAPPLVNVAAAHIVDGDADFDDMVMDAWPRAVAPDAKRTDRRATVLGAAAVEAAMGDIEPTPTHFSIGPPLSTATGPKNAAAWCPD